MVKGSDISAHHLREYVVYKNLHKTELKRILISLEMNLGQNNYLHVEKK